jgi:hypothetical protein
MQSGRFALLCLAASLALGCGARTELEGEAGSSSPSGGAAGAANDRSCKAFQPCGGDLRGAWTINSQCSSPAADYVYRTLCSDAKETRGVSGSMTFSDDGVSLTSALDVSYHDVLPALCAARSCGVDGDVYAGCTPGEAQTCICDFTGSDQPVQETYQILGQSVILRQAGEVTDTLSYCVLGNELLLSSGNDQRSYNFQLERSTAP